MRKKIVAGNWKMNYNLKEGFEFANELDAVLNNIKTNCEVVICVPFVHLALFADEITTPSVLDAMEEGYKGTAVHLGAQNCSDKVSGAYTGEVSAAMLASVGADYVILGHSERRAYFGETNAMLKDKVMLALENDLIPIFCIGEVLAEREAGKQNEVVEAQIRESLFHLSEEDFGKIVLAYEPVWAIGTGVTATSEQAQEMHAFIRKTIANKYGATVADETSILYGGSCNAGNAKELFANPDVDGGLIGGASLSIDKFLPIIKVYEA